MEVSLSAKLDEILDGAVHLLPEITIVTAAIALLVLELFIKNAWKLKTALSLAFVLLILLAMTQGKLPGVTFGAALVVDRLAFIIQAILLLTLAAVLIFPSQPFELRRMGEYHFLLFSLLLGGFLMVKAINLLVFYLSMELLSISSYVLVSIGFRRQGFEAGIKYLLFGALASGVMLYGMSLLYGLSGSLDLNTVLSLPAAGSLFHIAVFLFLVGLLFKLSMVPMHIWTPDIYQAAPTPVVAALSIIPKLAAFVFLYRSVVCANTETQLLLMQAISWLAVASMFFGNLSAIWQSNTKRMMAYSSIAHAGFMAIGVLLHDDFALQAAVFYAAVYALMNWGVFYLIACMEKNELNEMNDYSGVGQAVPLIAVAVVVLMVSFTGLPPTGGFSAKFLLFSALWSAYQTSQHAFLLWLFVFALINTVIALFYYLKIPFVSIFKPRKEQTTLDITPVNKLVLLVITVLILLLFFKADWLFDLVSKYSFAF